MDKKMTLYMFLLIFLLIFSNKGYCESNDKTIYLILDKLDFSMIEEMNGEDSNLGIMNIKARRPRSYESLFFSMATGRKVGMEKDSFKGIQKNIDGSLKIKDFDLLLDKLDQSYPGFLHDVDLFGEKLKSEGISYIGNDSSSILAADKNGHIENGEAEIQYKKDWLEEKTNYYLENSNILIISYKIEGNKNRFDILKEYINNYEDVNFLVFPKEVCIGMTKGLNTTLVPILYKTIDGKNGLLTSYSTKRTGIVTVLDIFPNALFTYEKSSKSVIGKKFEIVPTKNTLYDIKNIYKETINLSWITYILHGIVCFIQVYFTYFFIKNKEDRYKDLLLYYNFIIINIFVSFLLGFTHLYRSIFLYLIVSMMISYSISSYVTNRKINFVSIVSTLTYILLVFGIVFYPKFIYNSYIGYDNLIYGARYYGFNNGAMAVLLATSIISYFSIKRSIKNKIFQNFILFLYFILNIVALSVKYGANTGGFFTAIILFLVMIYVEVLGKELNIKNIAILAAIGVLILFLNMYLDINSVQRSHAGNLIYRIKVLGKKEFVDMLKLKFREIIFMLIVPPWNIVIVSQILFMKSFWEKYRKYYHNIDENRPEIKKEYTIFLITGIIAFVSNDTGIIAFAYMLQYLIALYMNLYCLE